jgi:Predicted membrane protein (DUF2306)
MNTLSAHGAPQSTAELATNAAAKASTALNAAARFWFGVIVLGQLMQVVYVIGFYGRSAASGHFEHWNKVMPRGYVAGDSAGNLTLGLHLLFSTVIMLAGALQLMPWVRQHAPGFHRWTGRVYLVAAAVMSLGGLYLVWGRGPGNPVGSGDTSQHIAISINALLILLCGAMALRHALKREFVQHRRWALRLFLVVSGVWFFRIGLMFWLVLNRGPVGFDPKTFTGPALTVLAFAQYLLPLAVLQLYLRAKASPSTAGRMAMAGGLLTLTLMMMVGIGAAFMFMWLPRLK